MGSLSEESRITVTTGSEEIASFRRSLKGVKALLESGITRVPDPYIIKQHLQPLPRHPNEQTIIDPKDTKNNNYNKTYVSAVSSNHDHAPCQQIPVIDLADLAAEGRTEIVKRIGEACEKWGFFQVINHGVPSSVIRNMMQVSHNFFDLPTEEKMELYSADTLQCVRFGTSYNLYKDAVLEWRDYLECPAVPLLDFIHLWPSKPSNFREITAIYATEVAALATRICYAISESLGLAPQRLYEGKSLQKQTVMLNHYPASPNPDLTIGLSAHSDASSMTVLLQDELVGGLEVYKEGKWIPIHPIPNAFVINLGDQTELLTNGRYKSVEHRASVNSERERISIATFFCPADDAKISAVPELLGGQLPIYKESIFKEYITTYLSERLKGKSLLEFLRLRN